MSPDKGAVTASVEGRELTLSNLDKVLFPSGFTKHDLIDYYARIGPVILRHLDRRPVTVKRFPDGTGRSGFITKNVPRHAPDWIATVTMPRKGTGWGGKAPSSDKTTTEFIVVEGLATLTWLANLAAIELHTPQWRIGRDRTPRPPDLLVFDLDPGEPADIADCAEVALRLRERLAADSIELVAKTSGSKGLQCYGRIASRRWDVDRPVQYAHDIAEELEEADPALVVSRMARALRPGKVFIDWGQNAPAKTTVTPYSLRALDHPTVSAPVTWEEVEAARDRNANLLALTPAEVLARVEADGDLFAPLLG